MSDTQENVRRSYGLFKNVPRFLKTEVTRRLHALEADPVAFDREALVARARLKRLYALLHVKPCAHAQAALFEQAREGSAVAALRDLARLTDPHQAARLVRAHRMPFLLVESAVGTLTPPVALALVETLADDELLDRLRLLAKRGLVQGAVRDALLARVRGMKGRAPRGLTWRKVETVVRLAGLDQELSEALFALVRPSAKHAVLEGHTALLVDGSASMAREGDCLTLAAHVGALLDGALAPEARLTAVLFGAEAVSLELPRRSDVGRWRSALRVPSVAVGTGTSAGAAVEHLARAEEPVSRLVVVTDGYENRPPRLPGALARYRASTGTAPAVCLVQPSDGGRQLAVDLRSASEPHEVFTVDRHLLGLDALIPSLGEAGTATDLISEILRYPLDE